MELGYQLLVTDPETGGTTVREVAGTIVTEDDKDFVDLTITAVHPYEQRQRTHDLTLTEIHTYYVLAGETPVLVHNSNGCPDVSIYKAPGTGMTDRLLRDGFHESDFPGSGNGYPDGRAYFGLSDEGKTIALDYASRGGYDGGVIEVRIPKHDFEEHFSRHVGSHNGVPGVEVAIPNTVFGRLNQYPRSLVGQ